MIQTSARPNDGSTARELLRFLDELMRAVVRVDLGDPGIAQLTLLEMRVLVALGEAGRALEIRELAGLTGASVGETGQACHSLRAREFVERAGGGRGPERALRIATQGRRILASLRANREAAVEGFVEGLSGPDRLRLDGAAHLLGGGLERLSRGMLAA
jgi:DNA-binding MarR family transcriptional regulator